MSKKCDLVGNIISRAFHHRGAPFSQRLTAHSSCVNALAWSADGHWLASAGDDMRVLLWDFHPLEGLLGPPLVSTGPRGNVLCLAFSASNKFVLSGGVDDVVLQYDVSRMCASSQLGAQGSIRGQFPNDGSIRAIAPHPFKDDLFLTASEDGSVISHDTRVSQRPCGVGILSANAEITGVQHHPFMEHLFATSDARGNCNLRDTRMAFGARDETPSLVNYVTKISKSGTQRLSNPETSSIVFDRTGTRLAVTMLHYLPTIYTVWDEWPLATCSGAANNSTTPRDPHARPPERSYVNACTMKNGSFGAFGPQNDCYYGAGSDDFLGYIWHIPEGIANHRRELSYSDWVTEPPGGTVGFAKSVMGRRIVPVKLQEPHFLAYGHKSIVNTVQFHPLEPYIATSGIERHVILHSPFEVTPACGTLTRTERRLRQLPLNGSAQSRVSFAEAYDTSDEELSEESDEGVIHFFDNILRQEGTPDVFSIREWHGDEASDPDWVSDSSSVIEDNLQPDEE